MFVLNSGWCCTRDQAFSHGKLDEDQFEWFASSLINYDKDNRWKIVLMHHHPFNYTFPVPIVDISTLEEGSRFLDIMGEKGIHLVLHGHRHHPRAETFQKNGWPHPVTFICAGSLAVNSAHRSSGEIPNTLHIIELSQSPGVLTLYNYQYTSAEGWIPIRNNCPETPLDAEMMLGKLFNEEERNQAILNLTTIPDRELEWKDLDESLIKSFDFLL